VTLNVNDDDDELIKRHLSLTYYMNVKSTTVTDVVSFVV